MAHTLRTLSRIAASLLLAGLGCTPLGAHGAEAGKPVDPAKVEIHVEHGVALPQVKGTSQGNRTPQDKPGFRIDITHWQPNGDVALYAIAPDGAQIALIPKEKPVQADADGAFTVYIDYARKGLGPGHWMFVAAGKPGIHEFETDLPRVEPPTAAHKKWRLVFGNGDK